MARLADLYELIQGHYSEFTENHEDFVLKGNKSAEGRARKAIGEIKKLVTEYRKESVASTKQEALMDFVFNVVHYVTFLGVLYLVYVDRLG